MYQEYPVPLVKLSFFFIQVKIIQVLDFDNWHPLNLIRREHIRMLLIWGKQTFKKGAQWRSGRVSDSKSRGSSFDPHKRHRVVSLSKTH